MVKTFFRVLLRSLVVGSVLWGIYLATWRFDPVRLERRAMSGEPEAQYRLGRAYFDGHLVKKDNRLAVRWLGKAATGGHAKAQAGLATLYANGMGVDQDYAEAVKWYRKAAEQGMSAAQNQLGVHYAQGRGTQRNLDEAVNWFTKSSEQGCKTARHNLKLALAARTSPDFTVRSKGKVYPAVSVVKVEADGITVAYQPERGGFGFAKVKFSDMPADLQRRYCYAGPPKTNETGLTLLTSLVVQTL